MRKLLNLEYATIHGCYWMYYGVIGSFASVFLLARHYSNSEIGVILAVGNVVAVILQPLVADLADRSKKITVTGISQAMTILLMVLTVFMFVLTHKSAGLSVIFVLLVAWLTALQPLCNSLNFKLQECGVHINFGVARSMGSLTYSILCAVLGTLVENHGVTVLPITGEIVLTLLLISLTLTKINYNKIKTINKEALDEKPLESFEEINIVSFIKRNRVFLVVNIGVLGVFFSNAILNNYTIQIVSDVGGNSEDMGRIFAVMAFLEIPTMFCFDWLRKRFRCESMLKVASICFTLKIAICFIANSVMMIYLAMGLQLLSFALFLPAMVHFIDEIMSKGEAVKGQAFFTIVVTASTVFASLAGGVILDLSGAKMLTLVATIVTGIGAAVVIFSVDKIKKKSN